MSANGEHIKVLAAHLTYSILTHSIRAYVIMLNQDDPKKCTANKLVIMGFASRLRKPKNNMIILNPFSHNVLHKGNSSLNSPICVIDCSWNRADSVLRTSEYLHTDYPRRVPNLLAGNPVNYAKLGKLSTVEAFAACYYILGRKQLASEILSKFKWGHTFLELNANVLDEYSEAENTEQILKLEFEYFGNLTAKQLVN